MSQSLANVLIHVIFSTKNRAKFIEEQVEEELFAYLATACRSMGCPALKVGGADDHVHILCSLARTTAIADLLSEIKADSSKWMKTKGAQLEEFTWQGGYGAFSIGRSQVETVKRYIERQRAHHRRRTFKDEFREFLRRYEIEYDERYMWD